MQSIDSMIEVLTAYKDGKKIEYSYHEDENGSWHELKESYWDFDCAKYRIAPESKSKVNLEAWLDPYELRWFNPTNKFVPGPDRIRVPSEDKEIEI